MLKIAGLEACDPWGEEAWDPCRESVLLTGTKALVGVRSLLDEEEDSTAILVVLAAMAGAELLEVKLRSDKGSAIFLSELIQAISRVFQQRPPLPLASVPKDTLDLWEILQRIDYSPRVVPMDQPKIDVADVVELFDQSGDEGSFRSWPVRLTCCLHDRDLYTCISHQALNKPISRLSERGGDWRIRTNQDRCSWVAAYCINDGSYVVNRACITHVVHVVTEYGCRTRVHRNVSADAFGQRCKIHCVPRWPVKRSRKVWHSSRYWSRLCLCFWHSSFGNDGSNDGSGCRCSSRYFGRGCLGHFKNNGSPLTDDVPVT